MRRRVARQRIPAPLPLLTNGWTLANHTIDHLENFEPAPGWSGIPAALHDPVNNGWLPCPSGPEASVCSGPGCCLDEATWQSLLPVNQTVLTTNYGQTTIQGFRAPRLEMNDNGLNALKAINYQYDSSLEEVQPAGWVSAAVDANTAGGKGFNWFPWPYTLDNGSPGIWNPARDDRREFSAMDHEFPHGPFRDPHVRGVRPERRGPRRHDRQSNDRRGQGVHLPVRDARRPAAKLLLESGRAQPGPGRDGDHRLRLQPVHLPPDEGGRVAAGDAAHLPPPLLRKPHAARLRFAPDRVHAALRQLHAREPGLQLGHGPHDGGRHSVRVQRWKPAELLPGEQLRVPRRRLGQYVPGAAGGDAGVRPVDQERSPTSAKIRTLMSMQDLVDYMQKPPVRQDEALRVQPDTIASPDSNGIFNRLGWTTSGATFSAVSGNAANLTFTIAPLDSRMDDNPAVSYVESGDRRQAPCRTCPISTSNTARRCRSAFASSRATGRPPLRPFSLESVAIARHGFASRTSSLDPRSPSLRSAICPSLTRSTWRRSRESRSSRRRPWQHPAGHRGASPAESSLPRSSRSRSTASRLLACARVRPRKRKGSRCRSPVPCSRSVFGS